MVSRTHLVVLKSVLSQVIDANGMVVGAASTQMAHPGAMGREGPTKSAAGP